MNRRLYLDSDVLEKFNGCAFELDLRINVDTEDGLYYYKWFMLQNFINYTRNTKIKKKDSPFIKEHRR